MTDDRIGKKLTVTKRRRLYISTILTETYMPYY